MDEWVVAKKFEEQPFNIQMSVRHLDAFTKLFCQKVNTEDLEFRCSECPFKTKTDICLMKTFKLRYAPDYKDFGAMGDL